MCIYIEKTLNLLNSDKITIEELQQIFQDLRSFYCKLQGNSSNTIQQIRKFLFEIQILYETTLSFDVKEFEKVVSSVQLLTVRLQNLIRQINESPNLTDIENLSILEKYSDSLKQIYDDFQTLKTAFEFLQLNEHISVIQKLYGMISQFIVYLKTIPNNDLHFHFVLRLLSSFQTIPSFPQNVFSISKRNRSYTFSVLSEKIKMILNTLNQQFTELKKSIDSKKNPYCCIDLTLNGINLESKLSNIIDILKFVESMVSGNTLSDIFLFRDSVDCASKIYQTIMSFQFPSDFFTIFLRDIDGMKHQPVGLDRTILTIVYKVLEKIQFFFSNFVIKQTVPPKMVKFLEKRLSFLSLLTSGTEKSQKGQKRMRYSDDDKEMSPRRKT